MYNIHNDRLIQFYQQHFETSKAKLTNATMSVADVASELPGLGFLGWLSTQV